MREGRFGAVASYGLGEVHVLAFDALSPSAGGDRWVLARILELSAMGYTRRALRAMPASDMMFDVMPKCRMSTNEIRIETGSGTVTMSTLRK